MIIKVLVGKCQDRKLKIIFLKPLALALITASIFFPAACARNTTGSRLIPPTTDPLVRDFLGYGVITASFTHIREEPGEDSLSLGYIRKGSLVKITERRSTKTGGNTASWILVEQGGNDSARGWLNEELVNIYDNESRALTASESINP